MECAHCGALQPADPAADHFAVLGVARRFDVDAGELEARYRELTRKLHPDRFARADARARRASLQRSVQLNEAWRALKDPVRRAEYLLRSGEKETVAPELLAEILELRQELAEARIEGDDAKVQAMARAMRARHDEALARVATLLSGAEPPSAEARAEAARTLVALRYFQRFLAEVAVHDEALADAADGAGHG